MSATTVETRSRARRIQIACWVAYGVLLGLDLLLIPSSVPINVEGFLSYVLTYLTPMLLALGASLFLAARLEGVERRFWGLLAAATTCFIIAEGYWTYYETWVDPRGPRIPNWFELGHLLGFTFFFLMLASMTELRDAPPVTMLRVYLDVIGASVLLFSAVYWNWTLPLFIVLPMGGWPVAIVAGMFPVAGTLLVVAMLLIIAGWKASRWRIWDRLVGIAVALFGVGVLSFPVMYSGWIARPVQHRFAADTILYGFGFYLLFMAAVYRLTSDDEGARAARWSLPQPAFPWLPALIPGVLALGLPVLAIEAYRMSGRAGSAVLVVSAALLSLVLILRSWLSSLELAHHRARSITDPVTSAFNQRYMKEHLAQDLSDARLVDQPVAAIAFDIVDFRDIVRALGAPEGDRVLLQLADAVRSEAPAGSTLYRIGDDEFVLIAPGIGEAEAMSLAHRVNAHVAGAVTADGTPVVLTAGVAIFPRDGDDAETLVSRALSSQQLARSAERADVVCFDAEVVGAADPLERLERVRRQSHRAKLRALAAAVDARDEDTRQHSEAVAEIVSAFALVLDLPEQTTRALETAALVHDIGKIGVPDDVLLATGRLSPQARELMRQHPELSEKLLAPAEWPEILPAVRHHHEHWDGSGYPDQLSGVDIPFEARVLSLADAFVAMTHNRRYRPALTTAQALAEIERCSGRQFDPQLAATFAAMVDRMHDRASARRGVARVGEPALADTQPEAG